MLRGDKKNAIIIAIVIVILICAALATVMIILNSTKNENDSKKNVSAGDNQNVSENNTEGGGYIDAGNEVEDDEDNETQGNSNSFEVQMFNVQFTVFEGEISGNQFGSLIKTAIASNEKNPEHQVNPTSNNLESFANIEPTETYVVTISYDNEGYVNSINIDLKEDDDSPNSMQDVYDNAELMAIQTFNAQFTAYEGECRASQVRSLISTVSASNVVNEEHQVDINITSNQVDGSAKYNVNCTVGNDGYITNIEVIEIK